MHSDLQPESFGWLFVIHLHGAGYIMAFRQQVAQVVQSDFSSGCVK